VNAYRAEHERLYDLAEERYSWYAKRGIHAPRKLWEVARSNYYHVARVCCKKYVRAKSYVKWYKVQSELLREALREDEKVRSRGMGY